MSDVDNPFDLPMREKQKPTGEDRREELMAKIFSKDYKPNFSDEEEWALVDELQNSGRIVWGYPQPQPSSPPRQKLPSHGEIVTYWEKRWREAAFGQDLDIGEPTCFRCGWYYSGDVDEEKWRKRKPDITNDEIIDKIWNNSHGWLERCHLQDHYYGGSEDVSNLVLMCIACHEFQPECETREAGLAYVRERIYCPMQFSHFIDPYINVIRRTPISKKAAFWRAIATWYEARWNALVEDTRKRGVDPRTVFLDDPDAHWPFTDKTRVIREPINPEPIRPDPLP